MAEVLKNFRERLHGMKRYNVGDDYPEDDKKRVAFLVKEGFLAEPEKPKRKKGADADADSDG